MTPPSVENPSTTAEPPTEAAGLAKPGERTTPPVFDKPSRATDERPEPSQRSRLTRLIDWAMAGRVSSWLVSAVLHLLAVLLLSLFWFSQPGPGRPLLVIGAVDPGLPAPLEFQLDDGGLDIGPDSPVSQSTSDVVAPVESTSTLAKPPALLEVEVGSAPSTTSEVWPDLGGGAVSRAGGMEGRTAGQRRGLALSGGGTPDSEDAVERGLAWLAAHQWQDGSWRFDLDACPQCAGACRDSGFFASSTASTGLALLCFLGAGYTHQQGPYQQEVQQGLYYLTENMAVTTMGGDLRDKAFGAPRQGGLVKVVDMVRGRGDNMYSHGIAALALTEAYGMTRDTDFKVPAQLAVDFIVHGQFDDGGWRYSPASESAGPGDMTVTGWQVMALKSGDLGGLEIPYETWMRLDGFLDVMQKGKSPEYRYLRGGDSGTGSTTAIGLLCRMFRYWPREERSLTRGVAQLGQQRPEKNHMYYNYYASQVLHHVGGRNWERWNPRMRDYLVRSQAANGHEAGSWYFEEAHSSHGGRLYTTAMAVMTLEVYYRYMPLYQEGTVE